MPTKATTSQSHVPAPALQMLRTLVWRALQPASSSHTQPHHIKLSTACALYTSEAICTTMPGHERSIPGSCSTREREPQHVCIVELLPRSMTRCGGHPGSHTVDSREVIAGVLIYISARGCVHLVLTFVLILPRWTSVSYQVITTPVHTQQYLGCCRRTGTAGELDWKKKKERRTVSLFS
jgi:hypothetical protein